MTNLVDLEDWLSKARAGLVPRKLTIKRGNKTYQAVRWVKPGVAEAKTQVRVPVEQELHKLITFSTGLRTTRKHTRFQEQLRKMIGETAAALKPFHLKGLHKVRIKAGAYLNVPKGGEDEGVVGRAYAFDGLIEISHGGLEAETLTHEIGHVVQLYGFFNVPGSGVRVDELWEKAVASGTGFPSEYAKSGKGEFFAECFAAHKLRPEAFRQRNPEMSAYLDEFDEVLEKGKVTNTHRAKEQLAKAEVSPGVFEDPRGVGRFDPTLPDATPEKLEKARPGLVQRDVVVHPQVGEPFKRRQWVRPEEEEVATVAGVTPEIEALVQKFAPLLPKAEAALKQLFPDSAVAVRLKTPKHIVRSMRQRGKTLEQIDDIVGSRVVVGSLDAIQDAKAKLEAEYHIRSVNDHLVIPDKGISRRLAVVIELDGQPVEVQLHTPELLRFEQWAEPVLYDRVPANQVGEVRDYAERMSKYLMGELADLPVANAVVRETIGEYTPSPEHERDRVAAYINAFQKPMQKFVGFLHTLPNEEVQWRLKSAASTLEKMQRRNIPLSWLGDIAATRIHVSSLEQVDQVKDEIQKHFRVLDIDDYNTNIKDGYYSSVHVTAIVDNKPVELQIRMPCQTAIADWAHDRLYKAHSGVTVTPAIQSAITNFLHESTRHCLGQRPDKPTPPPEMTQVWGATPEW